jgi:hypothetical protein
MVPIDELASGRTSVADWMRSWRSIDDGTFQQDKDRVTRY